MRTEPSPPHCEVGDDRTFVFIHDCKRWMPPDELHATRYLTDSPGERRSLPLETSGPPPQTGWVWVGEPGATIHPSIQCMRCMTHGFWRDGAWIPA